MIYHPTKLKTKEVFVILAKAYKKDMDYLNELDNLIREKATQYGIETDFLGLPYFGGHMSNEILELLGDDFSYWYYDCESDFNKFNKNIKFPDGSHPKVYSLEDLFDFSKEEQEEK